MPSLSKLAAALATSALLLTPAAAQAHGATTCAGADVPVARSTPAQARQAVVCLVNRERRAHHLRAMSEARRLDISAQGWTDAMVRARNLRHAAAGSDPPTRVHSAGYDWMAVGENIATGFATPAAVVNAWMHSPDHCRNILDPNYTNVGTGIARSAIVGAGGTFTQDFGTPMSRAPMSQSWAAANATCH